MRKLHIRDAVVDISALTRRQIKVLAKKYKITSMSLHGLRDQQWDDFIDDLLMAYRPDCGDALAGILDDLPRAMRRKVEMELIAETWGAEEEEKN